MLREDQPPHGVPLVRIEEVDFADARPLHEAWLVEEGIGIDTDFLDAEQRLAARRGMRVLAINGEPCAELPRFEAQALLDTHEGAVNALEVLDAGGDRRVLEVRGDRTPRITSTVLPGPVGLLRVDGFAFTDEETAAFRTVFASFENAGAANWIVDVRWCGGGVSIGLSRLLVDRGRLFSRVRHEEGGFPEGMLRQDVEADGTAMPFQRPLVVLIGPGSISGAESFAGPLQALGRATLVGERTAGLCGTGPLFELAPGWSLAVTTRETVFGPDERRYNREGVPPDVWVSPNPEDEDPGRDPQLEAAFELLRRRTAA
jgi:C-terminal processing protease CtpA/Prc